MEERLPDRGDILVRDDEQWTVVDLTKRHVRLLGSTGTIDVPLYRWPDGFAPLVPEQEAREVPVRALLVGGDAGGHLDRLEELSRRVGVDIVAHWPGSLARVPSKQLPVHIDLVIYLASHMSHPMQAAIKPLAKARGLPAATVFSQGYEEGLRKELERLGLRPRRFSGEYELPVAAPVDGRYVWTGSTWSWQEAGGPMFVDDGGSGGGGEGFLAGLLSFAALLGAVRS